MTNLKMHLRAAFAVVVALPLAAAGAQRPAGAGADTAARLPTDTSVIIDTLANGLTYYVRANGRPDNRAELRLVVDAGSILEDPDQRGLAHFVEHMAFNGTEHFEKQELVDYLESVGMRFGPDVNAYTSFDETVYMLQIPTDSARIVRTAFQILEDWAHGVAFDAGEIEKERGVVIEEWRQGRGAGARILDRQLPVILHRSRYAERLPIGTRESLGSFGPEAVRRFYRDWYRPDLMAVIAVGDFDPKRIVALITEHFARIPRPRDARERTRYPVPDHDSTLITVATDKEATTTVVQVMYKHPARDYSTVGSYRRSLMERLYNGMFNRRLSELVQTSADPPFIAAFSSRGGFVRTKEIYSLAALVKEGGVPRGLEALLTEAERVDRHGFTGTELDRQKRDMLRGMERAYAEREKTESDDYAGEYVRAFLEKEPTPGIAYEYRLTQALLPGITLEEINQLGRAWISDRNRVIALSAPDKEGAPPPTERQLLEIFGRVQRADVAAWADSVSAAPLVARAPEPAAITSTKTHPEVGVTEWRLANGVRVIVKPTAFKADQVLMTAWSPGGTSLAPDSLSLSADYADRIASNSGVGSFSAVELRKTLAGKAAYAGPTLSELEEGFSGSASPKDIETLFQLVWLYFTAPRVDSTAFASMLARERAQLENRSASPDAAFFDTLTVTFTGYHPRTRPITVERLNEIDLGYAMRFYRERFADASDFTFYFVGAISADSLKPLVQRYLGTLPSIRRTEQWRDVGITRPRGVIRKTVQRGVEPKARTQLLFPGAFEWNRANRHALASLGDVLRIRLREQLREEQGGTYGVGVGASSSRYPRPEYTVAIGFGSSPERLDELTRIVFQEIDSLKRAGPTAEELQKVKETQRRDRERALEENGFWISSLVSADRYGQPYRDILSFEAEVQGLTIEKIRAAARKYLDTANYVQVRLYPEGFELVSP